MRLNTTTDAVILYSKWNEAEPGSQNVMLHLKVLVAASQILQAFD
jgi:hypothetical protein